ncbi:MOSC domain-containing protein [Alphaproteobacteria bacterium]|nr:MOSC domain-containing protein [Alphaproteobacteria bacterium]
MATLEFLQRYPLKGFPGQRLAAADLEPGKGLAWDRHFAILSGAASDEPIPGGFIRAVNFIQNTYTDDLQKFSMNFDFDGGRVTLTSPTGEIAVFDLKQPESWIENSSKLKNWFTAGDKEPRFVRQAPEHGHWDFDDSNFSLLNLASHRVLEQHFDHEMDPVRHRSNLHMEFDQPWVEFDLLGKRFRIGSAEFEAFRPAKRCATISVDAVSGERDLNLAGGMQSDFGHAFLGIYCRVVKEGKVAAGDKLEIVGEHSRAYPLPENAPRPELWPRLAVLEGTTLSFEQAEHPEIVHDLDGNFRLHAIDGQASWQKRQIVSRLTDGGFELSSDLGNLNDGRYLLTGPF